MTVREMKTLLDVLESQGYGDEKLKTGLVSSPVLWAFEENGVVTIKTALSFTAQDLVYYTSQYYLGGSSLYEYDEDFAAHLYEVGIPVDLVREALGERWAALYNKVTMRICMEFAERKVSE